jgi:DNA polymerase III alpha subunit
LEDPTGLLDVVVFEDALNRAGETIVRHRAYLVDGTLQNNPERGLAIIAEDVKPYVVRTDAGAPVRIRRGVKAGPMGPAIGGAGAPEEESWAHAEGEKTAEELLAAEAQSSYDARGTLRPANR